MTFIDPTDIHMTGQQAEDFADAQCARLQPDHSAPDAWWIVAEKHAGKPAFAFRLRSRHDAIVGLARITRIRPDIPIEIQDSLKGGEENSPAMD